MARTAKTNIKIKNGGVLLGSSFDTLDFNTNISASDQGNGSAQVNATGGGGSGNSVYGEVPSGSGTSFTLAHTPLAGTDRIYRGGARQQNGTDYTLAGTTLTFVVTVDPAEVLAADYNF